MTAFGDTFRQIIYNLYAADWLCQMCEVSLIKMHFVLLKLFDECLLTHPAEE